MNYREPAGPQVVVIAMRNHVTGYQATTGAPAWRFDFPPDPGGGAFPIRLATAGEVIYALSRHWLACIRVLTGELIGQVRTEGATTATPGTLLAAYDRILVGQGGRLQCFSQDGRLLWQVEGGGDAAIALGDTVAQTDSTG